MSKNMNKHATKRKSATENYILKFLTVSSVSSDSIVKGIIDDIVNTAVKTAEVDDQKTKYLQHFINKHDTIVYWITLVSNIILKVYL
jgi:hypothetical protein